MYLIFGSSVWMRRQTGEHVCVGLISTCLDVTVDHMHVQQPCTNKNQSSCNGIADIKLNVTRGAKPKQQAFKLSARHQASGLAAAEK